MGISKILAQKCTSITIIGRQHAYWIAALADWLFDLRVKVLDDSEENAVVFANFSHEREEAQVTVHASRLTNTGETSVMVSSETYMIKDITRLVRATDAHPGQGIVSGRGPWNRGLQSVFGLDFEILMRMPYNVGSAMGVAARIFQTVATGDPDPNLDRPNRSYCDGYFDASYGRGFIEHVITCFPELEKVKREMEQALCVEIPDAKASFESKMVNIEQSCHCSACKGLEEDSPACPLDRFYYPTIFECVIIMARNLAGMTVAPGLCLSRNGVYEIFKAVRLERVRRGSELRGESKLYAAILRAMKPEGPLV